VLSEKGDDKGGDRKQLKKTTGAGKKGGEKQTFHPQDRGPWLVQVTTVFWEERKCKEAL